MRSFSTYAVIGLAGAFLGSAALAQEIGLAKSAGVSGLMSAVPQAEFRAAPQIAPSPFGTVAATSTTFAPADTMTAPMAPGSGATVDIAMTPDMSMTVTGVPGGSVDLRSSDSFSTASGDDPSAGVPALLGFDLTTSATTSYSPDASLTPNVTLGR
jgi:hypothetical protein